MLNITNLYADYGGKPALEDINLTLDSGELLVVLGPSGCGKTTLLNLIAGFVPYQHGTIQLEGKKVEGPGAERGVVFQNEGLLPWRNVQENVAFGLQLAGVNREQRLETARTMLKKVGLEGAEKRFIWQLSGGQRQKAAIARALLLEPELLICDEAVSSLDAATRTQILDLLLRVVKEKKIACLFISHDMALIRRISHRTGVLYKGTLAECAKTRDLCRDPWHPYTKALLDSVMPPDPLKARKQKVPAVHEGKSEGGCPYFGSCGYKMEMCKDAAPEMYDFEGRAVSCHLYSKQQRAGRNPNYKMTSQI